jgi:transglutaminase-like putative cysteine protease
MSPVRKTPTARRHSKNQNWIIVFSVALIVVTVLVAAYFWLPQKNQAPANSQASSANTDPAFAAFTSQFLDIMKNLNSSQTRDRMLTLLNPSYNQTDLFKWESSKMTFATDPEGSFTNPFQILDRGQGVCLQWSVVYVSACLALGYQSRLCVAVGTSDWGWIHVWAEDYYNGKWVHVDPSDKVWNQPHRYLSWGWGQFGTAVKVYAFEDNTYQDVTSTYA